MALEQDARLIDFAVATIPEQPFYISATSQDARPRKSLKHNDTFAVVDSHGDIGSSVGGPDGLFDSDTRFLSHLELLINGVQPLLLGSHIGDDDLNLNVDLTNPDIYFERTLVLPKDSVHISRMLYLYDGCLRERIVLQNFSGNEVSLKLSIAYDSDFADIFEVRGVRRTKRGGSTKSVIAETDVRMTYEGLDGVPRETFLCFEPRPTQLLHSIAAYSLVLAPLERRAIFVSASCRGPIGQSIVPFFVGYRRAMRERQRLTSEAAKIETTNSIVNEVLDRSLSDFYMLTTETAQGLYPYAGIPWYSTTFGRDGVIAAMQTLWLDPRVAKGVLSRLSYFQADVDDPVNDAQPGKILHEMRGGEMSALREVPFQRYYGSVDSTPLFVVLAGLYAERTGDIAFISSIWSNIERALAWMDANAKKTSGFLSYHRAAETGLSNQGWKDSYDAVFHADGRLAEGPIALAEAQGYYYAAQRCAGRCARALGKFEQADELERKAEALRERFEQAFWSPEIETYALALDGSMQQCAVRTSNAGQVLFSGIASASRAAQVVSSLLKSDMNTGWGLRTVSSREKRYNPMSYHNGSVWPHDNAMIAAGMSRYGMRAEIGALFDDLYKAACYMEHRRLPELFCGFRRKKARAPTLYPVACAPQAWASGAPLMIVQAMLGLEFDYLSREIRLTNPVLPPSIDELTVRDLRLLDASIDFTLKRGAVGTSLRVIGGRGKLNVVMKQTT